MLQADIAVLLLADSLTYTVTASDSQRCGWPTSCSPLVFDVPQFQGNLSEVDFSFTDIQTVNWGYNNLYSTPENFTATVTTTLSSDQLPISLSYSNVYNGSSVQGSQIGSGVSYYSPSFSASGLAPDPTLFEGTGFYTVNITPYGYGGFFTNLSVFGGPDPAGFPPDLYGVTAVTGIADAATLTITEIDPSVETPEPKWLPFVLLSLILILLFVREWRKWSFSLKAAVNYR